MTRFPAVGGGDNRPVASKDRAETFTENDLSLSNNKTTVKSESLGLKDKATGSAVDGANLNSSANSTDHFGVQVNPNTQLTGFTGILGSAGISIEYVRLYDIDNGVEIDRDSSVSAGSSFEVTGAIEANTTYWLTAFSSEFGSVDFNSSPSYSYTSSDFDVTGGVSQSSDNADWWIMESITSLKGRLSGSSIISWDPPNDVYRWDASTFQFTPDGETVKVYVEENDGSGWTEIQGPISRGDQIEADPGSNVRFRVELARSDTSNNPTLDAIYRRWVV